MHPKVNPGTTIPILPVQRWPARGVVCGRPHQLPTRSPRTRSKPGHLPGTSNPQVGRLGERAHSGSANLCRIPTHALCPGTLEQCGLGPGCFSPPFGSRQPNGRGRSSTTSAIPSGPAARLPTQFTRNTSPRTVARRRAERDQQAPRPSRRPAAAARSRIRLRPACSATCARTPRHRPAVRAP